MNGLTNYITEWNWTDIITTWYVLVDDAYQSVTEQSQHKIRSRGPAPLMSDSEVITVSLIIEAFFQGHEEGKPRPTEQKIGLSKVTAFKFC